MKLFKIFLMFIILSIVFFSSVYATESEQDLSNSLQALSSFLSEGEEEITAETSMSPASTTSTASQVVTTSNSSENKGLSISDIINIILIAVGLVLIFLGVAILLRSK